MPLLKRKPFTLAEPPKDLKPHELVYQVRYTKEIFRDYQYPLQSSIIIVLFSDLVLYLSLFHCWEETNSRLYMDVKWLNYFNNFIGLVVGSLISKISL